MTDEIIRLGLIGAGRIGRVHAESVMTRIGGATITGVADVHRPAAEALAGQYGIPRTTADYAELLADPEIDAVLICSATDTHAPILMAAAAAGKHIFCEKPIAFDLALVDAALAAVAEAEVRLMVGFNRRFDPSFARVKALVDGGDIGQPHLLRITSRDPAPPPLSYIRESGGLFYDMTIHDFDMARYLLGEIEEVYAAAGVLVDPAIGEAGDIDTAVITLTFANGALGVIDNSRQAVYGYDQRVEVFGSGGMARAENSRPTSVELSTGERVETDRPLYFFLERYMPAYVAEMQAFLNYLREGGASPAGGADGRAPIVVARAAYRSLVERRPVRLSEIG